MALWLFFYRDVTTLYEVPLTPPCFASRNTTKNAETHPPTMGDIIIEQPQYVFIVAHYNIIRALWDSKNSVTEKNGH